MGVTVVLCVELGVSDVEGGKVNCKMHFHETMFALSNCSRQFIDCVGSLTPLM